MSGGIPSAHCHVAVGSDPIALEPLIRLVQGPGTGALAIFLGTVRNVNEGREVRGMEYEAYGAMAEAELRRVAEEAVRLVPGAAVAVEHRVGVLAIGEVSVAIVAAHAHRAPAFEAARHVIEELKRRVPIWKREHYVEGDWEWLDPTAPRS